jgi:hypothetical protein
MRYLISALLLTALIVGWQRSAVAQHYVRGIVTADQDFELGWPNQTAPKACINIPSDAIGPNAGQVPVDTEITISLVSESESETDWPRVFREHNRPEHPNQRLVFPPIVEFSSDRPFTITNADHYFTIGICGQYRNQTKNRFENSQLGHPNADSSGLDFLLPRSPCTLRCDQIVSRGGATGYLRQLFAGSPFTATPLYAVPVKEGGLGGGGGSLSPFAAAENEP